MLILTHQPSLCPSILQWVHPKQEQVLTNWSEINSVTQQTMVSETGMVPVYEKAAFVHSEPFLTSSLTCALPTFGFLWQSLFSRLTCENQDTHLTHAQFSGCRGKTITDKCMYSNKCLFTNLGVCKYVFSLCL